MLTIFVRNLSKFYFLFQRSGYKQITAYNRFFFTRGVECGYFGVRSKNWSARRSCTHQKVVERFLFISGTDLA